MMRAALQSLSEVCGFAVPPTPYSYRHLGCWSARQAGATLAQIRTLLGHQQGSCAVRWYLGTKSQPDGAVEGAVDDTEDVQTASRTNCLPHWGREPWQITSDEINEVVNEHEVSSDADVC